MADQSDQNVVEQSSGNVFADLSFPHPEREQLKADLMLRIYRLIRERGLTQKQAGKILGIQQPHVSSLMRGRSGSFSVERLFEFLNALGQDVTIAVKPRHGRRSEGRTTVIAEA